jgi:hypothetical protein
VGEFVKNEGMAEKGLGGGGGGNWRRRRGLMLLPRTTRGREKYNLYYNVGNIA